MNYSQAPPNKNERNTTSTHNSPLRSLRPLDDLAESSKGSELKADMISLTLLERLLFTFFSMAGMIVVVGGNEFFLYRDIWYFYVFG